MTISTPKAVRVKTTDGWQDIGYQGPPGPPSGQMQLIYDNTLVAAAASIDIQNIPQTFAHLELEVYVRGDNASDPNIYLRMNNDATNANYDSEVLTVQAGAVYPSEGIGNSPHINLGTIPAAGDTAGRFSAARVRIPNYLSSVGFKPITAHMSSPRASTSQWMQEHLSAGVWKSTTAINRLTLLLNAGNFIAGSRVTLYGIKAEPEGIRQNFSSVGLRLYQCAYTTMPAGAFTKMKLSGAIQSLIEPASEFTVNADDSVTITNAGWYDLAASLLAGYGTSISMWVGISRSATPADGDIANSTTTSAYPRVSCSGHIYLNAGDKIYVHGQASTANSVTRVDEFSIVRTGAGPQGPAGSPLNIQESTTPPANPQIGDLWLYHPVAGVSWIFRYEPDQDATYPWQFIGGGPYIQLNSSTVLYTSAYNTWMNAGAISWTPTRSGRYVYTCGAMCNNTEVNWAAMHVGLGAGAAPGIYGKIAAHGAAGAGATSNITWEEVMTAGVARQIWAHTTNVGALTNVNLQYYQWWMLSVTPVRVA